MYYILQYIVLSPPYFLWKHGKRECGVRFLENDDLDAIKEHINKIIMPVLKKVPQETPKNHMLVGGGGFSLVPNFFYCPHNFRRYFDFSRVDFVVEGRSKPWGGVGFGSHKLVNKQEHVYDYGEFSVRVKRSQIEIKLKGEREWFMIRAGELASLDVLNIQVTREAFCHAILEWFIMEYGGRSEFRVLKRYEESKLSNDAVLDTIPSDVRFYSKVVKKVYGEANVEFSSPGQMVAFIENRTLENLMPELMRMMGEIKAGMSVKDRTEESREFRMQGWHMALHVLNLWIGELESGRMRVV